MRFHTEYLVQWCNNVDLDTPSASQLALLSDIPRPIQRPISRPQDDSTTLVDPCSLYVGQLNTHLCNKESLIGLYEFFGIIKACHLFKKKSGIPGKAQIFRKSFATWLIKILEHYSPHSFAFVTFDTPEGASAALNATVSILHPLSYAANDDQIRTQQSS